MPRPAGGGQTTEYRYRYTADNSRALNISVQTAGPNQITAYLGPDAEIEPSILYFGTPVVLISTLNEDATVNVAPMSSAWWHGWGCMLGLTSGSKTVENLRRTRQCVLNLPSAEQVEFVDRLALTTGVSNFHGVITRLDSQGEDAMFSVRTKLAMVVGARSGRNRWADWMFVAGA